MAGAIAALVLIALWSHPAQAYIDPSGGGLLFQVLSPLLALIVGVAVFLRDRVKLLVHRLIVLARPRAGAGSDRE
jgi:hypothetical protein